jgi:hypothetical protein
MASHQENLVNTSHLVKFAPRTSSKWRFGLAFLLAFGQLAGDRKGGSR